jgi:hypothetical protein
MIITLPKFKMTGQKNLERNPSTKSLQKLGGCTSESDKKNSKEFTQNKSLKYDGMRHISIMTLARLVNWN